MEDIFWVIIGLAIGIVLANILPIYSLVIISIAFIIGTLGVSSILRGKGFNFIFIICACVITGFILKGANSLFYLTTNWFINILN